MEAKQNDRATPFRTKARDTLPGMFVLSHITAFEYWCQARTAPARYRPLPPRVLSSAPVNRPKQRPSCEATKSKPSQSLLDTLKRAGVDLNRFTRPFHLLDVRNRKSSRDPDIRYHSARRCIDGEFASLRAFVKIGKNLYAPSPELCFLQLASILDLDNLIIAGCELCGSYQYASSEEDGLNEIDPLSSPAAIKCFLAKCPGAYGIKRTRCAADRIVPNAASPAEFALALLLSLPRCRGGYGLPRPLLNYEIPLGRYASTLTHRKSLRADLYWPERKVDVEYTSNAHHFSRKERAEDAERANALGAMGIQSIDVTWEQMTSLKRMDRLAASMRTHLKCYPRALTAKQKIRQSYLRTKILRYLISGIFEQPGLSAERMLEDHRSRCEQK